MLLWHKQFGHMPLEKITFLSLIRPNVNSLDNFLVCSNSKKHRLPLLESHTRHIDVWGPYKHSTYDGYKYSLTTGDDHSRHTWTHLMTSKSVAFTLIKVFVYLIKTQFQTPNNVIRTNNAYELGSSNGEGNVFSISRNYPSTICTSYTQQNGIV